MNGNHTKLNIKGLTKTYGAVTALDQIDLLLADGEFLTMLGPSGSGKSTLLWAVAGLNDPDGGEVWIDGTNATYVPPSQRDIGMVFQNYALFPHMTVADNISFPLEMQKMPRSSRREAVDNALDMVKLPGLGERFPSQLSGGQQQRIALARAFVSNPSIVLMDEPLGALDKKLRDHLQLEIKHIHEELGTTILYVTHDQEEAMVMSDRICLMNAGRIEQIGTPKELYFKPVSLFAADFLGESNMIEGIIEQGGDADTEVAARLPGVGEIKTLSSRPWKSGERVVHMTRPEAVELLDGKESRVNETSGTVQEVVISGAVTKLFVDVGEDQVMQVSLLTRAARRIEKGDNVRLGWDADVGVLLPNTKRGAH